MDELSEHAANAVMRLYGMKENECAKTMADCRRELERLRAERDAANARAQDAALDALAAQGQAAEAHEARIKAEAERDAALERLKAMETALSTLEVLPSIAAMKEAKEDKG